MTGALGWWRHTVLAGIEVGLLASTGVEAPRGWVACLLIGGVALTWAARIVLDPGHPPPRAAACAWLGCVLTLGMLGGLGAGGLRLASIANGALHAPTGSGVELDGFVAGFPQRGFGEVRVPLETRDGRVLAVVPEPVGDLTVGAEVHLEGAIAAPADGFERSQVERAGAAVEIQTDTLVPTGGARGGPEGALDRVRTRAEEALGTGMDEGEAALARGFVLGQDDRIDPATRDAFKRAGLSHLLAVSGQNVMLLAILGGVVFAMFGAGLRMRLVLTLLLIAAYVPIAGAGASIARAGVMGAAGILATLAGRPSERAYPLLLAAVITLLIDPRFGSDVGWQLSFAAVVGIMLWARPLRGFLAERLAGRLPSRLSSPLAEGAALTIAATIATAPLIAHVFEQVSLAALPANLAVLPAIAPLMWIGMAMGMLAQFPVTSIGPLDPLAWLGAVEGWLINYVAWVADVFAAPGWAQVHLALPGTAAPIAVSIAAGLALTVVLLTASRRRGMSTPRRTAVGLALVALVALLPPALGGGSGPDAGRPERGTLRITELDVGQGDSILLQPGHGRPVLVDGGLPGTAAAESLTALGIERLGAVVVTHDELDHAGGLATVLDRMDVGELVHARPAPELQSMARGSGAKIVRVAEGSELRFGRLELDVIWPPRERLADPSPEKNFDAIVMVARFAGYGALLSADAEQEVTHLDPGPLDVLKVAHHGSDDAGLESLLERSVPRIALIGVGAENSYGHPTGATIATLAGHGVCVLRTDLDGAATVELGVGGMRAWTEGGPPPAERAGCQGAGV